MLKRRTLEERIAKLNTLTDKIYERTWQHRLVSRASGIIAAGIQQAENDILECSDKVDLKFAAMFAGGELSDANDQVPFIAESSGDGASCAPLARLKEEYLQAQREMHLLETRLIWLRLWTKANRATCNVAKGTLLESQQTRTMHLERLIKPAEVAEALEFIREYALQNPGDFKPRYDGVHQKTLCQFLGLWYRDRLLECGYSRQRLRLLRRVRDRGGHHYKTWGRFIDDRLRDHSKYVPVAPGQ